VNSNNFSAELKRRNVYKVAIAYAVVAWLLMQVASQIFPFFEIPNWAVRLVVLLLIIGFPVALILAWAFELTPEGIKRTEFADELPTKAPRHRAWIYVVIIAGAISASLFFLGRYTSSKQSAELSAKSIAVLPFANQNRDPDTEYLSDGIPESIINSLSQLPNLRVMSRNSVFHYKGKDTDAQAVAKELKVQAVLTGRMTQRGDGLSISVELINAQDNSQIWGQQYNRKLADVFAVQEEIAKEISEKLRLKLTGAERQQLAKRPTENLKAFQYYTQGRAYAQRSTREDLLTAVSYYDKALEEDRNYTLAYAGLADAYAILGLRGYIAPIEGRRKQEEAARRALALDDNLAEAHAAFGQAYVLFAPSNFPLGDRDARARGQFQGVVSLPSFPLRLQICLRSRCLQGRSPSRSELSTRAHHEQQNGARVLLPDARPHQQAVASGALGSTHFDVPATQKRAQRNQIRRKLARSKFANWIGCFCHIRVLVMGRFN
jgi:adenylate cyclase